MPRPMTLTFTGVDEHTDLKELIRKVGFFRPHVEIAVLVGSKTLDHPSEESRRYPCEAFVKEFRETFRAHDIPCAIHLCGKYKRNLMDPATRKAVVDLCDRFTRVQVNSAEYYPSVIEQFADEVQVNEVILQHRHDFNKNLPLLHDKVSYLHDMSGGTGTLAFDAWPKEVGHNFRCGFAGGISPGSIRHAVCTMRELEIHPDFPVWLDMESGVRTEDDKFDHELVRLVAMTAYQTWDGIQ